MHVSFAITCNLFYTIKGKCVEKLRLGSKVFVKYLHVYIKNLVVQLTWLRVRLGCNINKNVGTIIVKNRARIYGQNIEKIIFAKLVLK